MQMKSTLALSMNDSSVTPTFQSADSPVGKPVLPGSGFRARTWFGRNRLRRRVQGQDRRACLELKSSGRGPELPRFDKSRFHIICSAHSVRTAHCRRARRLLAHAPPRLHQLRRSRLRQRQSAGAGGTDRGVRPMGVHPGTHEQLAPGHLAVAYVGLPALRPERRGAPFGQRRVPRGQRRARLPPVHPIDGRDVAQRRGGRLVRATSAARRISRVDRGAQGRAQRVLRFAHPVGLRVVCPRSRGEECQVETGLRAGAALFRDRVDEQTHARDLALRDVVVGCVAARAREEGRGNATRQDYPPDALGAGWLSKNYRSSRLPWCRV